MDLFQHSAHFFQIVFFPKQRLQGVALGGGYLPPSARESSESGSELIKAWAEILARSLSSAPQRLDSQAPLYHNTPAPHSPQHPSARRPALDLNLAPGSKELNALSLEMRRKVPCEGVSRFRLLACYAVPLTSSCFRQCRAARLKCIWPDSGSVCVRCLRSRNLVCSGPTRKRCVLVLPSLRVGRRGWRLRPA